MRKVYLILFSVILVSCGSAAEDGEAETVDSTATEKEVVEEEQEVKPKKSPRKQASGTADGVHIEVDYGSPYVKDRTIWGQLVPYDKVWRAGANEATAVTFESDVMFAGTEVSAGTYALFIIPRAESDWEVILNEEWSREEHGAWGSSNYNSEKDVAKILIAPAWRQESEESLRFSVVEAGIEFAWENAAFTVGVSAKN